MTTNKFTYVLFSLAMIAVLVFAAIPMTPAHAMSAGTSTSISATNAQGSGVNILVYKHVVKWYHGHRVSIRVCHWVHKSAAS